MVYDFKKNRPDFLKPILEAHDIEKGTGISRICRMCPTKLKGHLQLYCSGMCINAAKANGTYGKEV